MKTLFVRCHLFPWLRLGSWWGNAPAKRARRGALGALLLSTMTVTLSAQTAYQAGDVITGNFGLQNRLLWTNHNGQVYTSSNTTIRLRDFEGRIVFFCFFDVW